MSSPSSSKNQPPSRASIVKCLLGAVVMVSLFELVRSIPDTVGTSVWDVCVAALGGIDSVLLLVFGALAGLGRWLTWPLWVVALGGACVLIRHGWIGEGQRDASQDSALNAIALASFLACVVWVWTQVLPANSSAPVSGVVAVVFLLTPVFVGLMWTMALVVLDGVASLFSHPSVAPPDSEGPLDVL